MEKKLRACGEIRLDLNLIYYPLGDLWYAVNSSNLRYIVQAMPVYEEQTEEEIKKKRKPRIKFWELKLNEIEKYTFEDTPINKDMPYKNPIDYSKANEWLGNKKEYSIDEIYMDVKKVLQKCYDFADERDLDIAILYILQSWFSDILKAVFYIDVRSQMGGGKTILLELMQGLSRYGILANDMSFAVIPRIIDRYKCTLFFDEIDMINKHIIEDIYKILRTGYRKGQKYIRAKPKTFEPESFDCYGAKAFNYRSDIADDLKNRSLPINTSKSHDKILPIMNLYKEIFLEPIAFKIFCFYMNSLPRLMEVNNIFNIIMNNPEVKEVKEVNGLLVNPEKENNISITNSLVRTHFFSNISHFYRTSLTSLTCQKGFSSQNDISGIPNNLHPLAELSDVEVAKYFAKLLEKLSGRNIEIFSLIIHLCSYLGLDIFTNFKPILEEKAEFEDYDEEDMKNILREVLIEQEVGAGAHNGIKFRYYRDIQSEFNKKVHLVYGFKPDTKVLKKYLRELGFVDKKNKKVLKLGRDLTSLCLIYDGSICKSLGLPEPAENIIKC